jgi:hypothetical protein
MTVAFEEYGRLAALLREVQADANRGLLTPAQARELSRRYVEAGDRLLPFLTWDERVLARLLGRTAVAGNCARCSRQPCPGVAPRKSRVPRW